MVGLERIRRSGGEMDLAAAALRLEFAQHEASSSAQLGYLFP